MFKLRRPEEFLNFAYSTLKYICTHTYVNKIQFGILIVNLSCTSSNLSKPKKLNYAFVCKEEQTLYCGIRPSARRSDLAFPMIQVYLVISPKTRNIKLEYTMKLLKRFMIPIQLGIRFYLYRSCQSHFLTTTVGSSMSQLHVVLTTMFSVYAS